MADFASAEQLLVEPGSFRDRHGRVLYHDGEIYRCLSAQAWDNWQELESSGLYNQLYESGLVVETREAAVDAIGADALLPQWTGLLWHRRVPVISYPYEWSFSMLRDAAVLHLRLMQLCLQNDWILKDASPFNVQWIGSRPIFIDIPSFKPLSPGEPWEGYQQFCRLFLYPLMLQAYKGVDFHSLLRGDIDGIEPTNMASLVSSRDWLRPGVLTHVVMQASLSRRHSDDKREVKSDLKSAGFNKALIEANVQRLLKLVRKLRWRSRGSEWSHYTELGHYEGDSKKNKQAFVERVAASKPRDTAWDLGCNTGEFSRILANHSNRVVAMDADHLAVDRLYAELAAEGNDKILPLVMNLNDPSPGVGWLGTERKTLEQRTTPELVCCLALIHHVVITANVPLTEFVFWLGSFGCETVIEFVTKRDPMVQNLLRNKDDVYDDYEIDVFESTVARYFTVAARQELISGQRVIYHLVPKQ